MTESRDLPTYWILVAVLATVGATTLFLPGAVPGAMPASQELPASRPVMALVTFASLGLIYGGLGWLGLRATRAVGFPGLWSGDVSNRNRFLVPAAVGAGLGVVFIAIDLLLAAHNGFGVLPHPPFPTSLAASVTAAIGEELIFRLLLVGGGFWLLTRLIESEGGREGAFWAVTLFSAVAFTAAHLPSFLFLVGDGDPSAASLGPILVAQLLALNGTLSVAAAVLLRRYGLLAAIGVHFWVDIVWHVVYGGLQ
jgi:hypothetical protein